MKKFRITPLNIVAALALVFLVISFFKMKPIKGSCDFSFLFNVIIGSMLVVAFITDLIFRFLFKDLKRIWIVELIFITLTAVFFLLLQK
jgi:hypothetical protein